MSIGRLFAVLALARKLMQPVVLRYRTFIFAVTLISISHWGPNEMMQTCTEKISQLALNIEQTHYANAICYSEINATSLWQTHSMRGSKSTSSVDWLNSVFTYNCPGGVPQTELMELVDRFGSEAFTWFVGVLTEQPELVRKSLLDFGFEFRGSHVCMSLSQDNLCDAPDPEDFEVVCLTEPRQVTDWLLPTKISFEFTPESNMCLDAFVRSDFNTQHEVRFIGYYKGQAVSACSYFVHNDQVNIYWVGTLPEYRNRGFARKVVETAAKHAFKRFSSPIGLYATEMGAPVYRAIGFEPLYSQEHFLYTPQK